MLVVRNENSPVSRAVADDYAQRRAVRNVVSVRARIVPRTRGMRPLPTRFMYKTSKNPFVPSWRPIPYRLHRSDQGHSDSYSRRAGCGLNNTHASLDSYLAALGYDKLPGAVSVHLSDSGFIGTAWANRFWNSSTPFTHAKFGGYLVTRLDGYTEADAKAVTTRALAAEGQAGKAAADGKVLLDTCPAFGYADRKSQPRPVTSDSGELNFNEYNADMQRAADLLRARTCRRVDPDRRFRRETHRTVGIYFLGATTGITTPRLAIVSLVFRSGGDPRDGRFHQGPGRSCRPRAASR